MVVDMSFQNHGTIWLMVPQSEQAREWIEEHIPEDAMGFGDAVVIEHRFVGDIIEGCVNDGLEVSA